MIKHKPLLVMFVGVPGSGKTTFARRLAKTLDAITINSDALRMAMWGSLEEVQRIHSNLDQWKEYNKMVFGSMQYFSTQALSVGTSVVYDAGANHLTVRKNLCSLAEAHGGIGVVVRLQTPRQLAIQRVQQRDDTQNTRRYSKKRAHEIIEWSTEDIVEPGPSEVVITISGNVPYDEQLEIFITELEKLHVQPQTNLIKN